MSPLLVSLTDKKTFALNRPSVFIGRDQWRADVRLSGELVDEVHCELIRHGTGFRLINLSETGTLVNGKRVDEAVLCDGDELTIASHRLQLSCGTAAGESRVEVWSDDVAESEWATVNRHPGENEATGPRAVVPGTSPPRSSPSDSELWRIQLAGVELGPMPWDELYKMVDSGQAQLADPVRSTESPDWRPLSEVIAAEPMSDSSTPLLPLPLAKMEPAVGMEGAGTPPAITDPNHADSDLPGSHENQTEPLPVAPQYFVMLGETETGPVPLDTLQQLALERRLTGVTRVRREDESEWSVAGGLGIAFPPPQEVFDEPPTEELTKPGRAPSPETPARKLWTRLAWLVISPIYNTANAVRAVLSLSPKTMAISGVVLVVGGSLLLTWVRGWSQTALSGILTLDGKPLPAVVVTLTGMTTGDSAVGVTDGDGRFSAITLDGDLVPGNYHVSVSELPDSELGQLKDEPVRTRIPVKYQSLGTTDMIIEVMPDQSDYDIPLTTKLSGSIVDPER